MGRVRVAIGTTAGAALLLGAVALLNSHPNVFLCGTGLDAAWIECVRRAPPTHLLSPREELVFLASEDSGMRVCGNSFFTESPDPVRE